MANFRNNLVVVPVAIVATMLATAMVALWTAHASPSERDTNAQETEQSVVVPVTATHPAPVTVSKPDTQTVEPVILRSLHGALQNALGMIETGNNDHAIGRAGEVSRYQIMPSVWSHYSDSRQYRDPESSLEVATQHWAWLYDYFKKQAGREPTDFDMYVLWNTRHGYYAARGFQPSRLSAVVRDRAQRFSNLVEDGARREAAIVPTGTRG